ncbi:MAG: hypothetical protein JRN29_03030 [Nitrososphaerota archaeon]|nr:hypothetical protein [Nitrososphaerota archaeon]
MEGTKSGSRRKYANILSVLLLVSLVAVGSASVYVFYYATTTATVKSPDLQLYAGSDSTTSCTTYPCTTVSVSNNDQATVSLSLFPSVGGSPPAAATYYTNLTVIKNSGTASHTISSIKVTSVTGGTNLGTITVYYCTTQTEFNPDGTPVTACTASGSITSGTTTLTILSSPTTIGAGAIQYIELVGYAASGAAAGSTVSFNLAIQWS